MSTPSRALASLTIRSLLGASSSLPQLPSRSDLPGKSWRSVCYYCGYVLSQFFPSSFMHVSPQRGYVAGHLYLSVNKNVAFELCGLRGRESIRFSSNSVVALNTDGNVARFSLDTSIGQTAIIKKEKKSLKPKKMSRKAKLNELKWYRLKAKKKMKSPNPEVRITYKLEKAKRKEEWLIEKLRKYESPRTPEPEHDPESLTEEERFYLKRTGEKKKNYVPVGRRGVFGGVVLNMHLHWKKHETVKVVCKPCKPGQVYEYAKEIACLSKGTMIDIKANNTIIFYRGKNYIRPEVMSPPNTLSKQKALEKYKFEQSLEHTSQFIEKLEKELEDYHKYIAIHRKRYENSGGNSAGNED